jgi:SagB-type dehydrogenase family enzyme
MIKPLPTLLVLTVVSALSINFVVGQAQPSSGPVEADEQQKLSDIRLEPPVLDKGISVMQALKKRHSTKDLADAMLSTRHLSEVLWAADGVNRDSGERTAPSAMARYAVDVYAVLAEGIYRYEPDKHRLVPVAQGDHRKDTGSQGYVLVAPLNLVYVADFDRSAGADRSDEHKTKLAAIEAGCMAQNVYLYCASEGLGTTVRTSIDGNRFGSVAKLRPSQRVICAQAVGHPK